MIRGRESDGDDDDGDVRVITEAEAKTAAATTTATKKKQPQAAKKAVPPKKEVRDEDGDVEMGEVVPESGDEEDQEEAKVPPPASAKKAKPAKPAAASIYGEPCMNAAEALVACAAGVLPSSLRFNPKWLPEDPDLCHPYWSTLWTMAKEKVDPENNKKFFCGDDAFPRGSVVMLRENVGPRIHFFDAFADLALDEEVEQGLAMEITDLLAKDRRIIKVSGNDTLLGRAVESYNADTTMGGATFKKVEETPACIDAVVKSLTDRELLLNTEGGGIHRVSLVAIDKRAESINAFFSFKGKELLPDSPCYIICLGGMGRVLRIRGTGVKNEDRKNRSKGVMLGDFKAYSGLGIQLPGGFFQEGTIEVVNISGSTGKDPNGAAIPTIPMALLIVSTVMDTKPAAKKKKNSAAATKAKAQQVQGQTLLPPVFHLTRTPLGRQPGCREVGCSVPGHQPSADRAQGPARGERVLDQAEGPAHEDGAGREQGRAWHSQ